MSIAFILAMDQNRIIGLNNDLPWRLPADLAYVKKTTMGHTILMGRKTYESIGRPLPGRRNVIFTRNTDFSAAGCEVVHTLEEALEKYAMERLFVIGGAEIYRLFLPVVDRMYITEIHHEFVGDTYFPEVDHSEWKEVSRERGVRDEKNLYDYDFVVYDRIRP